jgi:hypothetical protein
MANDFNKEERVMFDEALEGFQDALVMSNLAMVKNLDQQTAERANNTIWRPMPYIMNSYDGLDQTANFGDTTQLSVPASINQLKSVPWQLTALELRDALQDKLISKGAKQKLSSDINAACGTVVANLGSIVSKRPAAVGFDDVAELDSLFNEQGVDSIDRFVAYGSRDYNKLAKDLANRPNLDKGLTEDAYKRALVGENVAGFDVFKLDYATRLTAAAGVGVTISAANQYYTPKATQASTNGGRDNVDNRFQIISIAVTSGTVKVGDAFTVSSGAAVNSVHHITKTDSGQLKTFRITRIVTGAGGTGTVEITPPIISAQGATAAEKQYQNVTNTPTNGATITFLNTVTAFANPIWKKSALEIMPGRIAYPSDAGMAVMRGTTDQGFELVMAKWADIKTGKILYRADTSFGVNLLNTEMAGIQLFNQT